MKIYVTIIILLLSAFSTASAINLSEYENSILVNDSTIVYTIILNNGDVISGNITTYSLKTGFNTDSSEIIPYIVLKTFADELIIYEDEIADIIEKNINPSPTAAYFLIPTAHPISENHFLGNYEVLFAFGGVGISDFISITAAYSFIPLTATADQIAIINAKFTIPDIHFQHTDITLALGGNLAWLNSGNVMLHNFALGTISSNKLHGSNFTIGIFYKYGFQEYPMTIHIFDRLLTLYHPDGAIGLTAGFERKFASRPNFSVIGEIWNANVADAANTGLMLGVRLNSRNFKVDYALSLFTTPFVAPFISFSWLPFQ